MRTRVLMFVVGLGLGLGACATTEPARAPGEQPQAAKESQRAELYPKVSRYLTEVAALKPIVLAPELQFPTRGMLPWWRDRVCPHLTGLPGQEGEFVLTRVSEIARAAGLRMDTRHCSPNLNIFVTDQCERAAESRYECVRGNSTRELFSLQQTQSSFGQHLISECGNYTPLVTWHCPSPFPLTSELSGRTPRPIVRPRGHTKQRPPLWITAVCHGLRSNDC